MGIDLETWRARIGLFHAASVGRHLKRQRQSSTRNVVLWNAGEAMNYVPHLFISCFMVVLFVQYVQYFCKKYKGALRVPTTLIFIFSGMKLCRGVASTFINPPKSILMALSLLLIIAGDVEVNPGPLSDQQVEKLSAYDMPILAEILAIYASKWRPIGRQIGFIPPELDNISAMVHPPHAPKECLSQMLHTWSTWPTDNHEQSPTIKALEDALGSQTVELGSVASDLRTQFFAAKSARDSVGSKHSSRSTTSSPSKPLFSTLDKKQPPVNPNQAVEQASKQATSVSPKLQLVAEKRVWSPKAVPIDSLFLTLLHDELSPNERKRLEDQLCHDSKLILTEFYDLRSSFYESLLDREIPVKRLTTHMRAIEAFAPQHLPQSIFEEHKQQLKRATCIEDAFEVLDEYCSFFNYEIIEFIIEKLGTEKDKQNLQEYKDHFAHYAKRRLFECPSKISGRCQDGQAEYHMKLDSKYENYSLEDMKKLQNTLCKIFQISAHVARLCEVSKGCIELIYQIPLFVQQAVFPLSIEQETALFQLGILSLTSGDYTFSAEKHQIETNHQIPPMSKDCVEGTTTGVTKNPLNIATPGPLSDHESIANEKTTGTIEQSPESEYTYKQALLSNKPVDESVSQAQSVSLKVQSPPSLGIWIFVDNSNLWIEAKKLKSMHNRFKTSEDHRVRIDMGKVADIVANGRPVNQGILYGSEPPPIDSVWKKIRSAGFVVKTQERSKVTGREKQLSTQLVADVTETAIVTPEKNRTTIALITGDADVLPAIKKVLGTKGWNVEVYMWRHSISNRVIRFAENETRLKIEYLDHYLDKVVFTNMKFTLTPTIQSIIKQSGVVLEMENNAFPKQIPTKSWLDQVQALAHWPCQYYKFETFQYAESDCWYLVLVFKKDSKRGMFNINGFLRSVQHGKSYHLPFVRKVQPFEEFITAASECTLEQIGKFVVDDVCRGYANEAIFAHHFDTTKSDCAVTNFSDQVYRYSSTCTL